MKEVTTDGFHFAFSDALDAFIFDETDKSKNTFHGLPMKAVDIVAEFHEAYVFVELKDYEDISEYDIVSSIVNEELRRKRQDSFKWLKNYLKYKYRDTYLYRHAEHKVNKPIHYICLLNFDNAVNGRMKKALQQELPIKKASKRWQQEISTSCHVLNLERWNANFPKWPVTRIDNTVSVVVE